MRGTTPEEQTESDLAAKLPPQKTADGRKAAITALLLLAGMIVLAFVRPGLAGTIGVLAAIILMIMLHELGHFVMAKRAGMKVTEFFLGFGPRLWSIRPRPRPGGAGRASPGRCGPRRRGRPLRRCSSR